MKKGLLVLFLFLFGYSLIQPMTGAAAKEAYVIPVHKEVERGLHAFLERAVKEAEDAGADVIIFDLNTRVVLWMPRVISVSSWMESIQRLSPS